MVGVVRRDQGALERLGPLEVTAAAFERDGLRVVICGVDTLGIQAPEVDELRERVADRHRRRRGRHPPQLEPHAPRAAGRTQRLRLVRRARASARRRHARLHRAAARRGRRHLRGGVRRARGGVGPLRARRTPSSRSTAGSATPTASCGGSAGIPTGWSTSPCPVLQSVRPDGSAIATVVGYGAHTVTTGVEYIGYSPDYPGWLRELVRRADGRRVRLPPGRGRQRDAAASPSTTTAASRGAWAAAWRSRRCTRSRTDPAGRASSSRPASDRRRRSCSSGSAPAEGDPPALAAAEEEVDFPLLPLPSAAEIAAEYERCERELAEAEAAGASEPELRILRYHGFNWARRARAEIESGSPRTSARGPISRPAHRRRRDRDGARRDLHGDRPRGEGALTRRRHVLRGLLQRLHLVHAHRERVPPRRLRARPTATRRTACRLRSRPRRSGC